MKNKLLSLIITLFICLNSTACVCELEEIMKKDSIFNPENIMKDYPVVFVGKLIKHEWPRLSLYKIIWNFKGLDNEDEIIAIKNNSCNMFDKIGDTILVSGYLNKPEVRFLHQTNCRGTKILRNLDGNYLDYFRRNKHFETNSQDSILKNTIYRSLNHISFLPEVAPKKKNEIKKAEDNLDEDTYSMYIAIGICLILLFFLFKKNIFSNKV